MELKKIGIIDKMGFSALDKGIDEAVKLLGISEEISKSLQDTENFDTCNLEPHSIYNNNHGMYVFTSLDKNGNLISRTFTIIDIKPKRNVTKMMRSIIRNIKLKHPQLQ